MGDKHSIESVPIRQVPFVSIRSYRPLCGTVQRVSVDKPQRFEGVEDGTDLCGTLLGLAAEAGGETVGELSGGSTGGWADGGQELAQGGHLRGQLGRPFEDDGRGGVRGAVVVAEADFGLLGGGCAGGLIVRAQPADEAALFFRRAFVVERNEAGEDLLFEGFGIGTATSEEVGYGQGRVSDASGSGG